jgi:hypothetical protein
MVRSRKGCGILSATREGPRERYGIPSGASPTSGKFACAEEWREGVGDRYPAQ